MATATKDKKTEQNAPPAAVIPLQNDRKRQIKYGIGIFLLASGIFICLSIISYFFYSWSSDQDSFFTNKSLFTYIFTKEYNITVKNWCGKLGALTAHILVFKGAGIASLTVGLAIGSIGSLILYDKKALPVLKYSRWVSTALLLFAPTFTYLFPNTAYPIGGDLGNYIISYFNTFIGMVGTGMLLLSTWIFFIFVVYALDITPVIKRMKARALKLANSMQQTPDIPDPVTPPPTPPTPPANPQKPSIKQSLADKMGNTAPKPNQVAPTPSEPSVDDLENEAYQTYGGNSMEDTGQPLKLIINETTQKPSWDLGIIEKEDAQEIDDYEPHHPSNLHSVIQQDEQLADEDDVLDEPTAEEEVLEEAYSKWQQEQDEALIEAEHEEDSLPDYEEDEEEELPTADIEEYEEDFDVEEAPDNANNISFSVKHQEPEAPPALLHGSHITIASNEPYAPELDLPDYKFPTLDLLENRSQGKIALDTDELEHNKNQIVQTLDSFGIAIHQITATIGPTVTLYEIVPAKGVRISKIKNLEDDIALSLAALGIRIIAPIPGKGTIGIEVPNAHKQMVSMLELLASEKFVNNKMSLPIALGKKIDNENYIVDLASMPHLLMAGATGQGKSVGINAILVSLLYKKHPSQLKFVMVDPKKVELSIYRIIEKHFLAKLPNEEEAIITDIKKVIYTLKALCDEMDDRYGLLKNAGARNIKEYNEKFISRRLNPENGHKYLPFIVLVIDEFADLIMTAGKEVEMPIARLAQLARDVGIHIIIATQRPSVNVITGIIKANFPARIAFKVSAKVDSRTILDTGGAEQLVGRGDMLISFGSELLRLQCAFVDTPEVEKIVEFIGQQRGYPTAHFLPEVEMDEEDSNAKNVDLKKRDALFEDCARLVIQMQSGSTSNLQRRFNLGYNRAGRIMDQLEASGIVGAASGSKPREVLCSTEMELQEILDALP